MKTDLKTVTLYTKAGCHLCEAVEQVIARVGGELSFRFVSVDIEADVTMFEKFKHDVPVVEVEGKEVARHRMTEEVLRGALER